MAADAHAGLVAALGGPDGWMALRDPAGAVFRAALVVGGRLEACVFAGPDHALPPRDWLMALFAQDRLDPGERRALLAGRRADGAAPEPPVCVCMGVGAGAIRAAIAAGCGDVAAVGAATKAGDELRLLQAGDRGVAGGDAGRGGGLTGPSPVAGMFNLTTASAAQ